jgi:pilus assembly protein CpaB
MLRYILLAVGAVCVLAGVAILFTWFGQAGKAPEAVGTRVESRVSVLTAAHAIPKGTLLRQDDLKPKELGSDEHLQPGMIVSGQEKDYLGAFNRRDFTEGEALIASDFIKPSDRNFLAAVLKPGYRAISVFVDAQQSVAGLALQGDSVDVILIQSFDDKITVDPRRRTVGETVLHDVRVIAIDQALTPPTGGVISVVNAEARIPKTVTLEVAERDAEKLLVAAKLGSFQLSLLPLDVAGADPSRDARNAKPVWASDVSLALDEFVIRQPQPATAPAPLAGAVPQPPPPAPCPPSTGSTLDSSVRCAPSNLIYFRGPADTNSKPKPKPSEAPQQRESPNTRLAPVSQQEGARYE